MARRELRSSTTPSKCTTLSFGPTDREHLDDSADLAKLVVEDLTGLVVGDIDAVTCGFGGGDKDHRLRFTPAAQQTHCTVSGAWLAPRSSSRDFEPSLNRRSRSKP